MSTVAAGIDSVGRRALAFTVLDPGLEDGNGLEVVAVVRDERPDSRVLTGYANIAMAVAAVKAGAVDYLAKPTDADAVEAALLSTGSGLPPPPENPMSPGRAGRETGSC